MEICGHVNFCAYLYAHDNVNKLISTPSRTDQLYRVVYKHLPRQIQVNGGGEHVVGVHHDLRRRHPRCRRLPHGAHVEGHLAEAVEEGQEISDGGLLE